MAVEEAWRMELSIRVPSPLQSQPPEQSQTELPQYTELSTFVQCIYISLVKFVFVALGVGAGKTFMCFN